MEEKDDFDVFIEKAENVVRRLEAGEDVEEDKEQLLAEALRVDPSTVPSTCVEPIIFCKILSNLRYPSSSQVFQDIRHRGKINLPHQNKTITNSPLKSNQSIRFRLSILFFISFFLILYYVYSPRPCPRPIW